jgi:uncharacterized protein (TIGR02266 family)
MASRKKKAKKAKKSKRPTKKTTARARKKPAAKPSKSADGRQHPRVPLRIKIDYFKDPGVFLYDYSRNLGRGGIFIETVSPFAPGTELNLHFTLPEQAAPVEVKGRVVWTHEKRDDQPMRGVPGMGIQFVNPDGRYKEALDRFFREIDYDNLKF